MERLDATLENIARAVDALRAGEVIAYPTETLYGLGADPFDTDALDRLFEAKGRDRSNPVLLIVGSTDHLDRVVSEIAPAAQVLIDDFWPGPLSIVMPKHSKLPDAVTAGSDQVCVRCPGLPWARALCDAFGGAVTSTSANRSGEPPVQSLDGLALPGVELGFDGGLITSTLASTIVDAATGRILRAGVIAPGQIEEVLQKHGHL